MALNTLYIGYGCHPGNTSTCFQLSPGSGHGPRACRSGYKLVAVAELRRTEREYKEERKEVEV